MRRWKWLAVLAVVGVLAAVLGATSAFAHGPANPQAPAPYESWGEEMYSLCGGAGGMMGDWGMNGLHMDLSDPVTLERVAATLGLTYEELTARLAWGETFAQIARTEGVDPSLVVATILAPQNEVLQVQVKYGYLGETQAQAILEQSRLWLGQAIALPSHGIHGPTYSPTYAPGYGGGIPAQPYVSPDSPNFGYTPGYGGVEWRGPGGMMGSGMMGGMMGR